MVLAQGELWNVGVLHARVLLFNNSIQRDDDTSTDLLPSLFFISTDSGWPEHWLHVDASYSCLYREKFPNSHL